MYTGVDIGGTKCAVISGDTNGNIIEKIRFETTKCEETIANIINAIHKIGVGDAIGISCGGPLDSKRGIIMSPPNLIGWDDVHITDILNKEFGVPVFLQNDANACALAEWKFGAGKGSENMIFLTFGTGMGAGLILGGRLHSGTNDMAGEVGHIRISEYGGVGYGKCGSFEGFCSGGGIAQIARMKALELLQTGKAPMYCKSIEDISEITAKTVADCAERGDATAIEVYKICGEKLGYGLAVLIDILNPEKIVIGSIFARSRNLIEKYMNEVIEKETLGYARQVCSVVPAQLGESIGDVAAISVAIEGLKYNVLY